MLYFSINLIQEIRKILFLMVKICIYYNRLIISSIHSLSRSPEPPSSKLSSCKISMYSWELEVSI